jgi:hypothetical protein
LALSSIYVNHGITIKKYKTGIKIINGGAAGVGPKNNNRTTNIFNRIFQIRLFVNNSSISFQRRLQFVAQKKFHLKEPKLQL